MYKITIMTVSTFVKWRQRKRCLMNKKRVRENELLEKIYYKYRQQIYFLAYRYLKNETLAEDIVQDTILKINEKIIAGKIISCHKLGGLIGYIVKGLCVNFIKRSQKIRYREIVESEIVVEDNSLDRIIINELVDKLPSEYRKVFVMKYINGMKYKEISGITGKSEVALRKDMQRAKIIIKEVIESGEKDE